MKGPITLWSGDTLNLSFDIFIPEPSTIMARSFAEAFGKGGVVVPGHHVLHLLIDNQGKDCLVRAALVRDGRLLYLAEPCAVTIEKGEHCTAKVPRFYKAGDRMPTRKKRGRGDERPSKR